MPDQPKTPIRAVRIPDDLWAALLVWAQAHGTDRSAVIRDAVRDRIERD